jgi:ubiquinone/menaquinone biosynthesis C-methylase UbiE
VSADRAHWDLRYRERAPELMSWYQAEPTVSLDLMQHAALNPGSKVIDVGGGASTLVDHLLERGIENITVLDIAGAALAAARTRLGDAAAEQVTWCEADVLTADLPAAYYDVWHDRAVFHFLTSGDDRSRYARQCANALRPGGALILATFAEDGPTRCSGLDVLRHSAQSLAFDFGADFDLCESVREMHRTPIGAMQSFLYTRWARRKS